MKNYLELLEKVLSEGELRSPARSNMPLTKELFCCHLECDLQKGFPLLTTKKVSLHNIIMELFWFLNGSQNIRSLIARNCHIWDDNAYKYYLDLNKLNKWGLSKVKTKEEFLEAVKNHEVFPKGKETGYEYGDLGNVYGIQWRYFESHGVRFDQISNLLSNLRNNPSSRYHIVSAWNPVDVFCPGFSALPACHAFFQVNIRKNKYVDLALTQRSCDLFLGVPYNLASYSLLILILAKTLDLQPGKLHWVGNSVHIYSNHFDAVKEQLSRTPRYLPKVRLSDDFNIDIDVLNYNTNSVIVEGYDPYPAIKAPLSVGL